MTPVTTGVKVSDRALLAEAELLLSGGYRLALVAAHDDGDSFRLVYLFVAGNPDRRVELRVVIAKRRPEIPSLAAISFAASRFEREMSDLFGINPLGHPQPRRLVLHQHWPEGWFPMRRGSQSSAEMMPHTGSYPFAPVEGAGVYEIPVGPVHAGLIEPGHFRFWVVGETILRMKARLWFVHKGIEKLFEGKEPLEGLALAERISGDSAVAHGLCYCLALEDAFHVTVDTDSSAIRIILLELERIYNHVSDIGALCNDVGFGLVNARALELREMLLRLNSEVTGHRLLRGGVVPGGAALQRTPSARELSTIEDRLDALMDLANSQATVRERFTGTAVLSEKEVRELGIVGVAARASGVPCDARLAHPFAQMPTSYIPVLEQSGDVMARLNVRSSEARISLGMIRELVAAGVRGPHSSKGTFPDGEGPSSGVGIAEAWRGVAVHRVEIDKRGRLGRVKVVDPSFFNWPAVPVSLADTIVPDFPLANKSFNLSYAGNDL